MPPPTRIVFFVTRLLLFLVRLLRKQLQEFSWAHAPSPNLVTARHIFVNDTNGLVKPSALVRGNASNQNDHQGYVLELDLAVLQRSDNWKEDLEYDVLVVRLMRDSKLMEEVQVKYEPTSGPAKVPFSSLLALRQIAMQKAVYLAGYRSSHIPKSPDRSEFNFPEIREGKTLLKDEQKGQIASDYLAVGGDSGAPVFMFDGDASRDAPKLVGIHIGRQDCFTPARSLFECAIATPMDFIFELISTFQ